MEKKTVFFATLLMISIIALYSSAIVMILSQNGGHVHKSPQVIANVYFYEGVGAEMKLIGESGNLITDLGENRTLLALNGTATQLCGIAVGNETDIAQTDTGLTTEATTSGFGRVQCNYTAAWMSSGDYSINYTASFDAITATISVNSAILCWSTTPSAQDAYAISFLTDGTQHQFPVSTPASRLTCVWVLTVNAN